MHLRRIRLAGKIPENIINFAIYLEKVMLTLFFRSSHWKRNRNRAETTENRQIMRLRWNVSKGCKSDI